LSGANIALSQKPIATSAQTMEDADEVMISWFERPQGSPMEYENAQKRILEVFTQWKAPDNFKIELFVIRVGDWGGYMLLDCDDPLAVHKFCSMLPALNSRHDPWFRSWTLSGSNLKRLLFAMNSDANDI
jgi:hypothetical protein